MQHLIKREASVDRHRGRSTVPADGVRQRCRRAGCDDGVAAPGSGRDESPGEGRVGLPRPAVSRLGQRGWDTGERRGMLGAPATPGPRGRPRLRRPARALDRRETG